MPHSLETFTKTDGQWAVEMTGICKRFGKVLANDSVDLQVRSGNIHGLVGENGAGKSTLMSILFGFYRADKGQMRIDGRDADIHSPQDVIAMGVGMVHQHFMLVDNLTALENAMLGAETNFRLSVAVEAAKERLNELMNQTGLHVPLDARVDSLSVGVCQRLEILKALFRGARVLILDEPTGVLTPQETSQLFEVLRNLKAQGTTIIIITHKLKEVLALCDDVTVMRAGRVVMNTQAANTNVDELAHAMVGRQVRLGRNGDAPTANKSGAELLRVRNLHLSDDSGVVRLRGVGLSVRAGEIVGIAGVSGNGQSELLDALAGLCVPQVGELTVLGATYTASRWLDPKAARAAGVGHVPEDRQNRSMVMPFAAWESAILGFEDSARYSRYGWIRQRVAKEATARMMSDFDVRPPHINLRAGQFSGGNQQKLVLAREMGQSPKILLVGQPTRGVDIGAIEYIHDRLRALREEGFGILLVSTELDEILALSDRVVVMSQGEITGELPIHDCDEVKLGLLMTGSAHPQSEPEPEREES